MKPVVAVLAIGCISLVANAGARAQAVLSADTYFTSDSQVLTEGTEVWGGKDTYNGGSHTLANGVSFDSQYNNANYVGNDLGSTVQVDVDGAYYGAHSAVSGFSDPVLNNILEGDQEGNYGQVFIKGLTTGQTYVVQMFAAMTQTGDLGAGAGGSPASAYSGTQAVFDNTQGGTTTLSYGQTYDSATSTYSGTGVYFITDTFVADAAGTEYISFNAPTTGGGPALESAIQIRELPEPSVYGMIGLGLLALVAIGRFRKLAA